MAGQKGANYHTKCTGDALATVEAHQHAPPDDKTGEGLHLFGASEWMCRRVGEQRSPLMPWQPPPTPADFCPFVHRVWIALEYLGVDYRYIEVDPYKKPQELLDVNPKGLVPALKIGSEGKCLGESTVIMEYLADRFAASNFPQLLPSDAYLRAQQRLASDRVNRSLIPSFYRYLQAQEPDKQVELGREFVAELEAFASSMREEGKGSFWDGSDRLGWTDVMIAPWIYRANVVLRHFRGLQLEVAMEKGGRFAKWMDAVLGHPAFRATTSSEDLYLDSYARCVA